MKGVRIIIFSISVLLLVSSCARILISDQKLKADNYEELKGLLDISTNPERPDRLPMYPNGVGGFMNDVRKHLVYPEEAKSKGIDGNVILKFVVKKDGSISNVKVDRSVHPLLDKAAIKAVKQIENVYPAFTDGKPTAIELKTLVTFINFKGEKEVYEE